MLSAATASHFRPTKILLAIDFSPSFQAAFYTGQDLAQHFNSDLILLTIVPMCSADKTSDDHISTFLPDSVKNYQLAQLANLASVLVSEVLKQPLRAK
jgi:hypothetical protein